MKSMKSLFLACVLGLMAMVSFSAPAVAAPLSKNFVADNGTNFQIENALRISQGAGYVAVKRLNGQTEQFQDASGAVWNKVKASAIVAGSYVKVYGQESYINTTWITSAVCQSSKSIFGQPNLANEEFSDGCQTHALLNASSN